MYVEPSLIRLYSLRALTFRQPLLIDSPDTFAQPRICAHWITFAPWPAARRQAAGQY